MESCEEQLTALRKEKIEVNRQKKQLCVFSYIEKSEGPMLMTRVARTEEMNAVLGDLKEGDVSVSHDAEDDIGVLDSELSDVSPSDGGSETASASTTGRHKSTARQKDLRIKAQSQAHAKQREIARAKNASAKQALADHRRLDEDVNKLERRLEGIEREFRKLLGVIRVKPLGRDRFYNRIWWFDGMGSASLLGSGGVVQYGTGRLFLQGPSEFDAELLERREDDDVEARRREEEGDEGMLKIGEWAVYSDLEEVRSQARTSEGSH